MVGDGKHPENSLSSCSHSIFNDIFPSFIASIYINYFNLDQYSHGLFISFNALCLFHLSVLLFNLRVLLFSLILFQGTAKVPMRTEN